MDEFDPPKFRSPLLTRSSPNAGAHRFVRLDEFGFDQTEITANRIADRMSRPTEASLSAGRAASQIAERVAHACARYSLPPLRRLVYLPFVPYSLPVCCSRVHTATHLPSMRVYTSSQNSVSSSRSLLFAPILSSPTTSPTCSLLIAPFFFIPPSILFFSFFLFCYRSTGLQVARDFAIRSERWKAVTGRPFRLPFTFASPFKDTGRGGSSGVQRCIYTYIYRTKSGRDARTRGR